MSDNQEHKKVEVKLPENVPMDYAFDKMVKNFIKQIQKEGKLEEVKRRRYYEKPSAIKRRELKEVRRRNEKLHN